MVGHIGEHSASFSTPFQWGLVLRVPIDGRTLYHGQASNERALLETPLDANDPSARRRASPQRSPGGAGAPPSTPRQWLRLAHSACGARDGRWGWTGGPGWARVGPAGVPWGN